MAISKENSFRDWLVNFIKGCINHHPNSFIVWCDPARAWKDLLKTCAENNTFELWAEESHELIIRQMRSPVKSSTLSGHAVQSAERSDAGGNIINQVDDMGTIARVFR